MTLSTYVCKMWLFIEALDVFNELILQKQYLADNALIVGYVEHIVHDKALQCFKETFFELLVRDSCVWTSLISRYVEHDY